MVHWQDVPLSIGYTALDAEDLDRDDFRRVRILRVYRGTGEMPKGARLEVHAKLTKGLRHPDEVSDDVTDRYYNAIGPTVAEIDWTDFPAARGL